MLYAIHCLDRENTLSIRLENYDAHRNYLNTTKTNIVLAGPVTAADQSTPIGSFMIICVDNQEEAERFNHGDPFYRPNVWDKASIRIQPFIKRPVSYTHLTLPTIYSV